MNVNDRILVIDHDPGIRETCRECLCPRAPSNPLAKGAALFAHSTSPPAPNEKPLCFDLQLCAGGAEGVMAVARALPAERPFALAFIGTLTSGIAWNFKMASHTDDPQVEQADLNRLLSGALSTLRGRLANKAKILEERGEQPTIKCFLFKIRQVFINLLLNAAQALETRGTITVSSRYAKAGRRASDAKVCIEIADTGRGIPAEQLKHIFDPFFTPKRSARGPAWA